MPMMPNPHPLVGPLLVLQIGISALITWLAQPSDPIGTFFASMVLVGIPIVMLAILILKRANRS